MKRFVWKATKVLAFCVVLAGVYWYGRSRADAQITAKNDELVTARDAIHNAYVRGLARGEQSVAEAYQQGVADGQPPNLVREGMSEGEVRKNALRIVASKDGGFDVDGVQYFTTTIALKDGGAEKFSMCFDDDDLDPITKRGLGYIRKLQGIVKPKPVVAAQ